MQVVRPSGPGLILLMLMPSAAVAQTESSTVSGVSTATTTAVEMVPSNTDDAPPAAVPLPAPTPATPHGPPKNAQVDVDLITDGAIVLSSLSFGILLEGIVQTGEIRPQQAGDPNVLLAIDRPRALSDSELPHGLSNVAIGSMALYAVLDSIFVQTLDRGERSLDYAILYLQSLSITLALTSLTKLAVRRPRPKAYLAVRQGQPLTDRTDDALSFYSGHTALTGAMAATAAYLAWTRPNASLLERWLVTAFGALATTAAGILRVAEGQHFPTDVIAGGLVGLSIGTVVPHIHRSAGVSIGATIEKDAAAVGVSGSF